MVRILIILCIVTLSAIAFLLYVKVNEAERDLYLNLKRQQAINEERKEAERSLKVEMLLNSIKIQYLLEVDAQRDINIDYTREIETDAQTQFKIDFSNVEYPYLKDNTIKLNGENVKTIYIELGTQTEAQAKNIQNYVKKHIQATDLKINSMTREITLNDEATSNYYISIELIKK